MFSTTNYFSKCWVKYQQPFLLKKTEYDIGDRALTLYNLVLAFLNCHNFIAKLFHVTPSKTNPGISACRAALCRYMYFHLYKHRQPVPGHQARELRNPCNLPQCQKTNKKAEKWIPVCLCALLFCCQPRGVWAGSNGAADQLSHRLTSSLLLVLCASNVHSYFVACLILFLFGVNTQEMLELAHKQKNVSFTRVAD